MNEKGKPKPQGFEGVYIGIPVDDHSYPATAAPPRSSASNGSAAALPPLSSASAADDKNILVYAAVLFCQVAILAVIILVVIKLDAPPNFHVEGVSVNVKSSNDSSSYMTAEWNIQFSIDTIAMRNDIYALDIDFRCMSQNWSAVVHNLVHDLDRRASLNATVSTLLPRDSLPTNQSSFEGLTLGFDMRLRVKFNRDTFLQGMCKNTAVTFPSDGSMEGIMEGGRRTCSLPHGYL